LKKLFASPAFIALFMLAGICCVSGCKKNEAPAFSNFTLDLANSNYSTLNTPGAFLYYNDLIIARINTTTFAALAEYCTHDNSAVTYNPSISFFVCSNCAGRYDVNGNVAFGPPTTALKKYTATLNGNILSITQ
jgi:cytochrome b6-f complex iron-sulfur subunit